MATIGTSRGTDLPNIDNTLSVADKTVKNTLLSRGFKLTPDSYTTIDELIKATREDVMPDLVKTYGEQGITGFLKLTGAINSGGSSDQIDWWEEGRRHRAFDYSSTDFTDNNTNLTISASTTEGAKFAANVQKNDVVMCAETGTRYIVQAGGATTSTSSPSNVVLVKLDDTAVGSAGTDYVNSGGKFVVLGNMYAQGTNQPTGFTDPGIVRYTNPYMIVKDRYEVNGSQATNVGYVNLGGGDYRWFMYGEQEARARFEDKRELMMLFGEKRDGAGSTTALDNTLAGSEGYFAAVEDRGILVSSASSNPMDSFSEFDDIILELDKQGAPSEYAMYVNRKQDLAIDDMLASGIATGVTAGLPGQFGAFQNSPDMAVQLGFKSFTRGGYTFHKHDWRLLNDPTLLGASSTNFIQGAMVPLRTVNDARSGASVPALSMHYKEANGYSREMEHWVTGGGVLGHTNNGDLGTDQAVFHYRSEIALCVQDANTDFSFEQPANSIVDAVFVRVVGAITIGGATDIGMNIGTDSDHTGTQIVNDADGILDGSDSTTVNAGVVLRFTPDSSTGGAAGSGTTNGTGAFSGSNRRLFGRISTSNNTISGGNELEIHVVYRHF